MRHWPRAAAARIVARMNRQPTVRLIGRSSSHFTRVAAMFAHDLGVTHQRVTLHDMNSRAPADYGGHPALKIPTLQVDGAMLFGTENICRRLAELGLAARVLWPEELTSNLARNAQELVWHAMATQVSLVLGVKLHGLPGDNDFFDKQRTGLRGALTWLDEYWPTIEGALPAPRDVSLLEVTLFCLVEHLAFRPTLPLAPYANLRAFAARYGARTSARRTPFHFDPPPGERP